MKKIPRLNALRISRGVSRCCFPLRLRSALPGVDAAAALRACSALIACGVVGLVCLWTGLGGRLRAGVRPCDAGVRRADVAAMLGRRRGVVGLWIAPASWRSWKHQYSKVERQLWRLVHVSMVLNYLIVDARRSVRELLRTSIRHLHHRAQCQACARQKSGALTSCLPRYMW
jgi:hypothetical protein